MIYLLVLPLLLAAAPFVTERLRKPMDDRTRQGAEGKFARLSQGTTYYRWIGPVRGPVAVCVHGLTTPSYVWDGIAQGLARMGYRVLVYDLYGRGFSDRPDGLQDEAFFLTQLNDLLADQKIKGDFVLAGYSMGGAVATSYAATHPERIRHLILIASAGLGALPGGMAGFIRNTPLLGDWLMYAVYPRRHRAGTELERSLASSVENIVDRQQRELTYRGFVPAVLSSFRGLLGTDFETRHKQIHRAGIPVLALWGGKDDLIPLTAVGMMSEWNRKARQEVIEDAGHALPYSHTDEALEVIRDTLSDGPS